LSKKSNIRISPAYRQAGESTNRMQNYTVDKNKVLHADLCFAINGACIYVQNRLGRFAKEKQFGDALENRLKEIGLSYVRELTVGDTGNRTDFVIDGQVLLEIKAKPFLSQDDYAQVQRYLQVLDLELGLVVNFWAKSAMPHRVLRKH